MERIHWKVRPYVLTAGRTRTRQQLLVHTMVSVPYYDPVFAGGLAPEARSLYEQARRTCSIAELSALCGISLGVTRVVLDDLVTAMRVYLHPDAIPHTDHRLLERIRDGLRTFT
jgi:hypothetical protein